MQKQVCMMPAPPTFMMQCIRRSCPCCFKPGPQERTQVNILCLGLEAAGKTTLLSIVAGEPTDNIQPTMGR